MATTIGKLAFMVVADSSGVVTGLQAGESAFRGFTSRVTTAYQSLRAQLALNPFAQMATSAVKLAASAETASVQFEVLLGSAEKAKAMIDQLRTLDAKTPLDFSSLRDAAVQLLNVETNTAAVLPLLQMLSDTSLGSADKFQRMTYAMSQVIGAGRLLGTELKQMREAGFNPLAEIAKRTGESMGDVTKRMEAGGVSVREVIQAFEDATGPTGRYFGMTEKGSKTIEGRFSALTSATKLLFTEIGEKLLPTLKALTETGLVVVKWVDGLSASTVQTTIKIAAMTAAFAKGVEIAPAVIAAGMGIVRVLKAIASGQAIAQALGGPKGLATLAIGLAAATAAGITVNAMFADMESEAGDAAKKVGEARQEVSNLFSDATKASGTSGVATDDALKNRLKDLGDQADEVRKKFADMRAAIEGRRGVFTSAALRFTVSGAEAVARANQEAGIQRQIIELLRQERAELQRIEDATRSVEDAIKDQEKVEVREVRL